MPKKCWGLIPSLNYVQTFLSPVTQQLSVHWTRLPLYISVIPATAVLFWQFGESTAGVMPGWGFPQGKEPGGLKGVDFQTHRCCWILVSRQDVWAHGSELFILWTQAVCLCLTRLLQAWSAMFDAAATSQPLNKAGLLRRRATLACPTEAWVLCQNPTISILNSAHVRLRFLYCLPKRSHLQPHSVH